MDPIPCFRRMRQAFFIDEDDWKEKLCARSDEVVGRAPARLATIEDLP